MLIHSDSLFKQCPSIFPEKVEVVLARIYLGNINISELCSSNFPQD